ncbi:MAG TPA: membrane protein insertase YidC [candidate division Zixibacteria bacterium]|nr:membrane protein insertase YidC [candidate division Zixibacteria bacterium]
MDKKTLPIIIGLALIIIFYYPLLELLGLQEKPKTPPENQSQTVQSDTSAVSIQKESVDSTIKMPPHPSIAEANIPSDQAQTAPDTVVIKTKQYEIHLSTHGGGLVALYLNEYTYRDDDRINILKKSVSTTPDFTFAGETFSTAAVDFTCSMPSGEYDVSSQSLELSYSYLRDGAKLIKRYRFYPDNYHFDLNLELVNADKLGFERQYQINWNTPLDITEPQASEDYAEMNAIALMAGSRVTLDDFNDNKLNQSFDGQVSWAGVRSKYFTSVIIPKNRSAERVSAKGEKLQVSTLSGPVEGREITVGMTLSFASISTFADSFTVFVGPLDYQLMSGYDVGLEDILGIGTTPVIGWIIKPFAWAIIWLLPFMYNIIPNYGVVIIIFALLVKLITLPLSMKSFKSMQAMKDLQPKVEELKKKHKNNPQAMNQEMMRMYKAQGVNPLSGCLPILPQMPLFFALFSVFRSTILLRDAPFVWFIDDLSRGAASFTDPYIILVVIMVAAQFVSQKFTMASTQQNKIFLYIMPVFLGFIFYRFAAGLVLYWTCFSIFSLLDYILFKRRKNPEIQTV